MFCSASLVLASASGSRICPCLTSLLISAFVLRALILYSAKEIIVPHRITRSWYTGRWWLEAPPRCTNSPPINGRCTNHRIAVYNGPLICGFNAPVKGLKMVRQNRPVKFVWISSKLPNGFRCRGSRLLSSRCCNYVHCITLLMYLSADRLMDIGSRRQRNTICGLRKLVQCLSVAGDNVSSSLVSRVMFSASRTIQRKGRAGGAGGVGGGEEEGGGERKGEWRRKRMRRGRGTKH